jgi:hypothetical protein
VDVGVDHAAAKAFNEKAVAEATTLRNAFDETPQLQRRLLINGRGPESAEAGKLIVNARRDLQASAQELLNTLEDPRLAASPEVQKAKALVRDFARAPQNAEGGGGISAR